MNVIVEDGDGIDWGTVRWIDIDPLRAPDTDDEPWPTYPPTPARTDWIAVALLAGLFALVLGRVVRRWTRG